MIYLLICVAQIFLIFFIAWNFYSGGDVAHEVHLEPYNIIFFMFA